MDETEEQEGVKSDLWFRVWAAGLTVMPYGENGQEENHYTEKGNEFSFVED